MRKRLVIPALLASMLGLAAFLCLKGSTEDRGQNPCVQIMKTGAGPLVSVRYVLEIGGEGESIEISGEITGVLVDSSGLVMVSDSALHGDWQEDETPAAPRTRVSNFTVVFPEDDREYDAVLAATDAKLSLAFVSPAGLGDRKIDFVDFAARPSPVVMGAELVGVDRLGKGFDYAPYFEKYIVAGEVLKPRRMYVVSCSLAMLGLPIYDLSGRPVGVLTEQNDSGRDLVVSADFLVPADAVASTIQAARKRIEEGKK